jgi:hypothetical protein
VTAHGHRCLPKEQAQALACERVQAADSLPLQCVQELGVQVPGLGIRPAKSQKSKAFFIRSLHASDLLSFPKVARAVPAPPYCSEHPDWPTSIGAQRKRSRVPHDTSGTTGGEGGPSPCELRNLPRVILGHIGLDKPSNEGKEAGGRYARA